MIVRIVHLTIDPACLDDFLTMFDATSDKIRSNEGCEHLELLQHKRYSNMFTTYSHWASEDCLNAYRESELFKQVWSKTKTWFAAPAVANSYESIRKK
jgi:quinol monooxygenase YgiN